VKPAAQADREEPIEPPTGQPSSSGRAFHQKYLAALQAGNLEDLLSLYHPDAILLSSGAAFNGVLGIAEFFRSRFGGVGSFKAAPSGEPVEGPDSLACETSLEKAGAHARIFDGFVLRDGRATYHFTFASAVDNRPPMI
jgi:hypothetical protein